jgi:hypothetical protein
MNIKRLFLLVLFAWMMNIHAQDTITMPSTGNGGFYNTCYATVIDNGEDSNYTNDVHAQITISPLWVQTVSLYFEEFDTEIHFDSLTIYDGPGTAFPRIGVYSGNQLQGQTVTSTGSSITLEFRSDDIVTGAGWKAWVNCVLGNEEEDLNALVIYPNPTNSFIQIKNISIEDIANIFIIDMQGRIVKILQLQNELIDVNQLVNGIYILKIEMKNGKQSIQKFQKN